MRYSLLKSSFIDQFFFSKDYKYLKHLLDKLDLWSDSSNEERFRHFFESADYDSFIDPLNGYEIR